MRADIVGRVLIAAIATVLFLKVIVVFYMAQHGLWSFGKSSDADYYHSYALGDAQVLANHWGLILRWCNDVGLYSRQAVTAFLMVIGFLVIPFMIAEIGVGRKIKRPEAYYVTVLLVSLYPTLFYYSLDIFRDVVLCFSFLVSVYIVGRFFVVWRMRDRIVLAVGVALLSCFMFLLRPYLGASFVAAFLGCLFFDFARQRLGLCAVVYLLALNGLYMVGGLSQLLLYRSKFESILEGGSNLGIEFDSVYLFVPVFLENVVIQLAGLYFSNPIAVCVFFIESIPLLLGGGYVLLNRKFADRMVSFLVLFFVFYGTVWLIGNDNMGTAVRLRLCNYLAVVICVAIVYVNKKNSVVRVKDS